MLPASSACCSELVERREKSIGSLRFHELDVWPELQNFTGNIISRTASGSSYEEGRQIFQLQAEQAGLLFQAALSEFIPGYRYTSF